jgi:molecular chaperone DnaK
VGADGGFVTMASLLPRRASTFTVEARDAAGAAVVVDPASFTIVQGLTISDPPLSRTIGVALASDHVQVYFERGAPLPARRTFSHQTVETVARGSADSVLRIPIVQGEFTKAHLCRLVGTLEIPGDAIRDTVPTGSKIDVTIELDRGGRMTARALVPAIDQVFEQVAHLLVPEAAPGALDAALGEMRRHLVELRTDAFRHGLTQIIERLDRVEGRLAEAERDIDAAHGGDADAAQKARRTLLEIDASLAEADLVRKWPELDAEAREWSVAASHQLAMFGTVAERKLLDEVLVAVERARSARDPAELERQMRLLRRLANAALFRNPRVWEQELEAAAADLSRCTDLPRAQRLVAEGKAAQARGDDAGVRTAVQGLWALMPVDEQARRRSFDSGVQ